jgi:hypothetical protein
MFRRGIVTLALSIELLAAACSALTHDVTDEGEEQAARAIEQLGSKITWDEKAAGRPAIGVVLSYTAVREGRLKELAALKQL